MIGLRSRIELWIGRDGTDPPVPVPFIVDSGASYSFIGLEYAIGRGLPVPPEEAEVDLQLQIATGRSSFRVRPGRIKVWWTRELKGYHFDWPVLFQVDAPLSRPCILGLGGVLKTCDWHFTSNYSYDAPYGSLTLTDTR